MVLCGYVIETRFISSQFQRLKAIDTAVPVAWPLLVVDGKHWQKLVQVEEMPFRNRRLEIKCRAQLALIS